IKYPAVPPALAAGSIAIPIRAPTGTGISTCASSTTIGVFSSAIRGQIYVEVPRGRRGAVSSRFLHACIGQVLMDQPHCHRALPHRGGAPLDRAASHVTRGEYARHASLQQKRLPKQFLPVVLIERRIVQLPTGQDEAALVEFDTPFEPAGVGLRTDEDKERPYPKSPAFPRAVVLDHDPLQAVFSRELSHPRADQQLDVRGIRDPVYEVAGHVLAQIFSP